MKLLGKTLQKYLEYKAKGKHKAWYKELEDNYKYQLKHRAKEKRKEAIELLTLLAKGGFTNYDNLDSVNLWSIYNLITGESTRTSKLETLKNILQNL